MLLKYPHLNVFRPLRNDLNAIRKWNVKNKQHCDILLRIDNVKICYKVMTIILQNVLYTNM